MVDWGFILENVVNPIYSHLVSIQNWQRYLLEAFLFPKISVLISRLFLTTFLMAVCLGEHLLSGLAERLDLVLTDVPGCGIFLHLCLAGHLFHTTMTTTKI